MNTYTVTLKENQCKFVNLDSSTTEINLVFNGLTDKKKKDVPATVNQQDCVLTVTHTDVSGEFKLTHIYNSEFLLNLDTKKSKDEKTVKKVEVIQPLENVGVSFDQIKFSAETFQGSEIKNLIHSHPELKEVLKRNMLFIDPVVWDQHNKIDFQLVLKFDKEDEKSIFKRKTLSFPYKLLEGNNGIYPWSSVDQVDRMTKAFHVMYIDTKLKDVQDLKINGCEVRNGTFCFTHNDKDASVLLTGDKDGKYKTEIIQSLIPKVQLVIVRKGDDVVVTKKE
jgi:hypothetical protein